MELEFQESDFRTGRNSIGAKRVGRNDGCGRREEHNRQKRGPRGFPQPLITSDSKAELTAIERKL